MASAQEVLMEVTRHKNVEPFVEPVDTEMYTVSEKTAKVGKKLFS